ncbi:MAG: hypothetical protein F9K29_07435 [Hyphomicrobiaceae bacterium]|nr:MAG: hypothetical protein F9K29_07435 [Hyphomicrobiaceae bacterium]
MPNGIHICIFVYGATYTSLLAEILLANLAAMVLEIPEDLRRLSRVRIVTTGKDIPLIEASPALPVLRQRICVEILNAARLGGYEQHGNYGPMVESQRIFVVDAARENAALFFVGPDQVYSRGSFALFVDLLRRGYRVVIGPGPRAKREAARAELRELIAASPDGSFAPDSDWLIDLFFRHWHPINDQFLIEYEESIWWKAYVCNRPHPDELLFRFFQGPTFVAWPRHRQDDFDGFIDQKLPELSCNSWREIYVVDDARDCLALDLTRDDFVDVLALADFPRVYLLQNLFNAHAIKDLKLIYGLRTCRLHRGDRDLSEMQRKFDRVIDPLILLALAERKIRHRFGAWAALIFRNFCVLNTHTLGFILGPFSARLARKWKDVDPLAPVAPIAATGPAQPE